jgi:hypothetical protein
MIAAVTTDWQEDRLMDGPAGPLKTKTDKNCMLLAGKRDFRKSGQIALFPPRKFG